jgi:hypothetical protein
MKRGILAVLILATGVSVANAQWTNDDVASEAYNLQMQRDSDVFRQRMEANSIRDDMRYQQLNQDLDRIRQDTDRAMERDRDRYRSLDR